MACVVNNVQNDRLIILKFPFDLLRKTFLLAWVGIFFAFQQVFESNNSSIACCLSGASVPDKQTTIIIIIILPERQIKTNSYFYSNSIALVTCSHF